jgi:hypothetical protein
LHARLNIRATGFDSPVFDRTLAKMKTTAACEVPSGHDVMVGLPDRLVEILLEVAIAIAP